MLFETFKQSFMFFFYFIGKVSFPYSGFVEIWSSTSCICPKIELGTTYFILGHENAKRNQLIVDKKIIMQIASPLLETRMIKYAMKYQYRLRKRRAKQRRWLLKSIKD